MSNARQEIVKLRQDIYQANPIIQSCKSFNTLAMRVFYLGLCGVNPHLSDRDKFYDKEFPLSFIPNEQLVKIFGNTKYLYDLKKTCEFMFKNDTIELTYDDGGWKLMHLFSTLEYRAKEGLYIQFDPKMRPFLLDLIEKTYTRISLKSIFYLTSPYAMRLLELMLQYQNIPGMEKIIKRSLTVEEIRFSLNVPSDAYQGRQNNFKKKVIDDPIAEINSKTKYRMDYTVFKVGRKITRFEFTLDTSRIASINSGNLLASASSPLPIKKDNAAVNDKPIEKKVLTEAEMAAFLAGVEDEEDNDEIINPPFRHIRVIEEEEIEPVENTPENAKIASLLEMQNYDSELEATTKAVKKMKKDAESCGLKLEDFYAGEIPIKAEYADLLRGIYKNNLSVAELTLKEIYHMTLERFVELYKP